MDTIKPAMPVKQCEAVRKLSEYDSNYGGQGRFSASWTVKANEAERILARAWAGDQATHAGNAEAIAHNLALRTHITEVMQAAGVKDDYRVPDTKSRSRYPKSKLVYAGYKSDIAHFIPVSDGFAAAELRQQKLAVLFAGWRSKADEEKNAKAAEAEREKTKRMADMELATILVRYGLPIDSEWWSVAQELRKRDKYLDLACAMENVRCDWNDGCDEVSSALGRFEIVAGDDAKIAADVASAVVRFSDDRDGRYFRDTTWSYGALYTLVADKQLLADGKLANERARR